METEYFCLECGNRRWEEDDLVMVQCGGCCCEMVRVDKREVEGGGE